VKCLTEWFPAMPEPLKPAAFKEKSGGKVNDLETTLAGKKTGRCISPGGIAWGF